MKRIFLILSIVVLCLGSGSAWAGYARDYQGRFGCGGQVQDYAQDLGAHWTRVPIDITNENYTSLNVDDRVMKLQAAGVIGFAVLNPGVPQGGEDLLPTVDRFAQGVASMVERYDGDGVDDMPGLTHPVKVWELVNEYHSGGTLQYPDSLTQSMFIEYVTRGAQAVKAACPDCLIAYDPFSRQDALALLNSDSFSPDDVDIVSYHTYTPLDMAPGLAEAEHYVLNFPAFLQELGLDGKETWVTEYAVYNHADAQKITPSGSQEDNARWFAQTTAYGLGTGLFQKLIYTEITPPASGDDPTGQALDWMALVDSAGNKRPIYYTFKKAAELYDAFDAAKTKVLTGTLGEDIYGYGFRAGSSTVYVLWAKEGTAEQTVTLTGLTSETVQKLNAVPTSDGDFNETHETVTEGSLTLQVSSMPVYIVDTAEQIGSYTYYLPYIAAQGFDPGLAFSNTDGSASAELTLQFYTNSGSLQHSESRTIPAGGQTAFIPSADLTEPGWLKALSTQPVYGLALLIGKDDSALIDMDFKETPSKELRIPHLDNSAGWTSTAMLCNPNPQQAEATLRYIAPPGPAGAEAAVTIPAMGAVQYDLETLQPGVSAGSAVITSTHPLVGFLLYKGLETTPPRYAGLSILPAQE